MTNDDAIKDLKDEGKKENHEGWKVESAGQAQKWAGALTGDTDKEVAGEEKQLEGNSMKHEGKAVEHMANAEKEMDKAATPIA
jgi:hypothetical protein